MPGSEVFVYVDGNLYDSSTANKSGTFSKDLFTLLSLDPADTVSVHSVRVVAETPEGETLTSGTFTLKHDSSTIQPKSVTMVNTGDNGENVTEMDLEDPDGTGKNYRIWPDAYPEFSFEVEFDEEDAERAENVYIETINDVGEVTIVELQKTEDGTWVGTHDYDGESAPTQINIVFTDTQTGTTNTASAGNCKPTIDPSGIVYEAIESNPVSGATASVWYSPYADGSDAVLWDGTEYDNQINPQTTGADGSFEWFVPHGYWQVRVSKEGYADAATDWLPVPPPQLGLLVPMVTTEAPAVEYIKAYPEYVEVAFTQYMNTQMMISIYNLVDDQIDYLSVRRDAVDPQPDPLNEGVSYAKVFRLVPSKAFTSTVRVWGMEYGIKNYAGVEIPSFDTVDVPVEVRPESISGDGFVSLGYGETYEMTLSVLPAEVGADKTITVSAFAPSIASASAQTLTTDENGQATVTLTGNLPGTTEFTFSLAESTVKLTTTVQVRNIGEEPCQHTNTVLEGYVEASCGVAGYTGDTYCADCGVKLVTGSEIPALNHEFRSMRFTESCYEPCFSFTGDSAATIKSLVTGGTLDAQYCIHCYQDKFIYSGGSDLTSYVHTNYSFEIVRTPPTNHANAEAVLYIDDTSELSCEDEPICLPTSYEGTAYMYCHDCDTLLVDDGDGNFVPVEEGAQALNDLVVVAHDFVAYPGEPVCDRAYVQAVSGSDMSFASALINANDVTVSFCSKCGKEQILVSGVDKTEYYHSQYDFTLDVQSPYNHQDAEAIPTSAEGLPCEAEYLDLPEATASYQLCPTCNRLLVCEPGVEEFTVVPDDSSLYDVLKVVEHTYVDCVEDGDICEEYAYTISGGNTDMLDYYYSSFEISVKYCTTCGKYSFFADGDDASWAVNWYNWNLTVTAPQHHADAYDIEIGDATVCGVYTLPWPMRKTASAISTARCAKRC